MANRAKDMMRQGGIALKTTAFPPTPDMVELLGYCGVDIVELNWEYTPLDIHLIENMVRAADLAGVICQVKVRELDPLVIWDVLDTGAKGILLPQIKSAAEAREAVEIIRNPPAGRRRKNLWWGHSAKFGTQSWDDRLKGDEDIIIGCVIETQEAVESIDAILAVDGITYVSCGYQDLGAAMRRFPQAVDDPVILEMFETVINAVSKRLLTSAWPKMNAGLGAHGLGTPGSPWSVGRSLEDVLADERIGVITCSPFPHRRIYDSLTADVRKYRAIIAERRGAGA